MIKTSTFMLYLLAMAGTTYLLRMVPLVLFKKKIENKFIRSFLYYVPYAVLGAMTFPAILYSTHSIISATIGLIAAIIMAYREKSLLLVAATACCAVLLCEFVMRII